MTHPTSPDSRTDPVAIDLDVVESYWQQYGGLSPEIFRSLFAAIEALRDQVGGLNIDLANAGNDNKELRERVAELEEMVGAALAVLPGRKHPRPDDNLQRLVNLARGLLEADPFARACVKPNESKRAEGAEVRVVEIEAKKWETQHTDTMNKIVQLGIARDAAEARAGELAGALEIIAGLRQPANNLMSNIEIARTALTACRAKEPTP